MDSLIKYKEWLDEGGVCFSWVFYALDVAVSFLTFVLLWFVYWDNRVSLLEVFWTFLTFPMPLHIVNVICFLLWRKSTDDSSQQS